MQRIVGNQTFAGPTGVAVVSNTTEPNKLNVFFENGNSGNYNVWNTDYTTYSLVYSCNELSIIPGIKLKQENAWILSRTTSLDASLVMGLRAQLLAANVQVDKVTAVPQNC